MVLFNYSTKELTAKIVYYGPGLCGKTTNLEFVYESLPEEKRGRMLSLSTQTDRTLYFDFLPVELGDIRGMKTRVQLYTVPGQVFYDETRRMVLKGVDGVVFVADSQQAMAEANLESFRNLQDNLQRHGTDLSEIPMVLQFNKRDLPDIQSVETMNAALNRFNAPFYEAVATTGIGVHDTLKAISKLVLRTLTQRYENEGEADSPELEEAAMATSTPVDTAPEQSDPHVNADTASSDDSTQDWECDQLENELEQMGVDEIQGLLEEVDGFDDLDLADTSVEEATATGEPVNMDQTGVSEDMFPASDEPAEGPVFAEPVPAGESDIPVETLAQSDSEETLPDEDGNVWMGADPGTDDSSATNLSGEPSAALTDEEVIEEPANLTFESYMESHDQQATMEQAESAEHLELAEQSELAEQAALPAQLEASAPTESPEPMDAFQEREPQPAHSDLADLDFSDAMIQADDRPALKPGQPDHDGQGNLKVPIQLDVDGKSYTYILTLSLELETDEAP